MSIYGICEKCGNETKDYICSSCIIDEIDNMKVENERLLRGDLTMSDKLGVTKHEDLINLHRQFQELQRRVEELEHRNEKPKRSVIQTSTYEIEALESKCHELIGEISRLKSGAFTPEELQNLCHNLSEDKECEFKKGCNSFQEKLFGKSAVDEEMERCIKIVQSKEPWISKKWTQTIENEIRQR